MVSYKRYPCCGAMHGIIDILDAIIKKFSIKPEDIKELNVSFNLLAELSLWKNREIRLNSARLMSFLWFAIKSRSGINGNSPKSILISASWNL